MKEDRSFGIILVDRAKEDKFLLLKHNSGHWSHAKGHKEGNETDLESALRELKEESGIEDCEVSKLPEILEEYVFEQDGEKWHKVVKYFIAFTKNTNVKIQESEISEYKWATYEEAINTFNYDNNKEVLKKAKEYLDEYERTK